MNDPHVVALEYVIEHGPDIDWSRAAPLDVQGAGFDVRVENGRVSFSFTDHHASKKSARDAVEERYIPEWEFVAGLDRGPNVFKLRFDRAEIEDRNPPDGPPTLKVDASFGALTSNVNLAPPAPRAFPAPPDVRIRRSPDVDSMYQRYLGHLEGREPLPSMAYFCLTVMLLAHGNRRKAAKRLAISDGVLEHIQKLSGGRGGEMARKAAGRNTPYTPEDERVLKSAVKTMIRRAAEVACDPERNRETITLEHFRHKPGISR